MHAHENLKQDPYADNIIKMDLSSNSAGTLAGTGTQDSVDAAFGVDASFNEPYSVALSYDFSYLYVGVSACNVECCVNAVSYWESMRASKASHVPLSSQDRYALREIDLTSPDNSVRTVAGTKSSTGGLAVPAPALDVAFVYVKSLTLRPGSPFIYFVEDSGKSLHQNAQQELTLVPIQIKLFYLSKLNSPPTDSCNTCSFALVISDSCTDCLVYKHRL